jgi:hypothetical protein
MTDDMKFLVEEIKVQRHFINMMFPQPGFSST